MGPMYVSEVLLSRWVRSGGCIDIRLRQVLFPMKWMEVVFVAAKYVLCGDR